MPKKNQKNKIIEHLNKKWTDNSCPMCKSQDWDISSVLELRQYVGEYFDTSASIITVIPVICRNCGNTILINEKIADINSTKKG